MNTLTVLAAATFNLVCSGQSDVKFGPVEPYESIFRIDLNQSKWCEEDCKQVNDIVRIEPTRIVLRDIYRGDDPRTYFDNEYLDRETGEHHRFVRNKQGRNPLEVTWKGRCRLEEFSGFGGERNLF